MQPKENDMQVITKKTHRKTSRSLTYTFEETN